MTPAQAEEIVGAAMPALMWGLGLVGQHITVEYAPMESGSVGLCQALPDYQSAQIVLDPEQHGDDVKQLLDTLRHELLHVLLGSSDTYRSAVGQATTRKQMKILDISFASMCETHVTRIERMLDSLLLTPDAMLRMYAARSDGEEWMAAALISTESDKNE
jgi:hypothetical protein